MSEQPQQPNADDTSAAELLDQGLPDDPDALALLYLDFLRRFQQLQESSLYPTSRNVGEYSEAPRSWWALANELKSTAEHLWRDIAVHEDSSVQAHDHSREEKVTKSQTEQLKRLRWLELSTRYSRAMMVLWVEVNLYYLRCTANFEWAYEGSGDLDDLAESTVKDNVQSTFKEYWRTMAQWGRQLRSTTRHDFFKASNVDARRIKILSVQFSPENIRPEERGWLEFSSDVHAILLYQYYEWLGRASRAQGHWARSVWLWMLRITSGYGLKPARLVVALYTLIALFAAAYFVNDASTRACSASAAISQSNVFAVVIHYLYVTIVHLFSVGQDPTLCGAGVYLSVAEGIAGYTLLLLIGITLGREGTSSD